MVYLGPGTMKAGMALLKLSPIRAAHFFAQTAHETGGFKHLAKT
jgi:predicted chitinase